MSPAAIWGSPAAASTRRLLRIGAGLLALYVGVDDVCGALTLNFAGRLVGIERRLMAEGVTALVLAAFLLIVRRRH